MPPFPPGITRSAAQRQRAATGVLEALAMHGLQGFALAEPFLPDVLKARSAHITFARWCG
jgi:hypothetical protein